MRRAPKKQNRKKPEKKKQKKEKEKFCKYLKSLGSK